jgi:hypothetical protein
MPRRSPECAGHRAHSCQVVPTLLATYGRFRGKCLSQLGSVAALRAQGYMHTMVDPHLTPMNSNWAGLFLALVACPGCGGQVIWEVEGSGGIGGDDLSSDVDAEKSSSSGGNIAVDPDLEAARLACELAVQAGVVQPTTDRVWSQEICSLCPRAILECAHEELHWCVPKCLTGLLECECSEGALCVDEVRVAHGFLALCASP